MLEAAAQCTAEVPDVLPLPAYQMQLNVRIVAVIDIPQRLIDLLDPSLNCFLMLFQATVEHQEIADQVFVKVMFESFAMTWEVFIFDAVERGGEALGIVATNLHSLPELSELGEEIAHACERLIVTAKLNHQIRHAMSAVATSVVLPNEEDRLRLVDEAVEKIDHVLMDLVPTTDEQERLRFYLEQSR